MNNSLDAITQRLQEATPGPWVVSNTTSINAFVADCGESLDGHKCLVKSTKPTRGNDAQADANLIANAPTDIAWLLSQLKEARKEAEEYRDNIDCANNAGKEPMFRVRTKLPWETSDHGAK